MSMPVLVDPTFDGRADDVGFRTSALRQGADEQLLGQGHGLGHERGVAADQVDADLLGRTGQSACAIFRRNRPTSLHELAPTREIGVTVMRLLTIGMP